MYNNINRNTIMVKLLFPLPKELIDMVYSFDDNEINKKLKRDCLKQMINKKEMRRIVKYISYMYIFYNIYKDHDHTIYTQHKCNKNCSQYILSHIKYYPETLIKEFTY